MKAKVDIYEIITERIMELLKKGTIPWKKGWKTVNGVSLLPTNFVSKKAYKGINTLLLGSLGYSSPYFLTFNQAKSLGGCVRKGEKGTPVVFWKFLEGKQVDPKTGKPTKIPLLRYYTVFNVTQCDGLKMPETIMPDATLAQFNPIIEAEKIVENMPQKPAIKHQGSRACYSPLFDSVTMPEKTAFETSEDYYNTLFHELAHSTGHSSRLARKGFTDGTFGSDPYAREELVAEMSASFLSGNCGIVEKTIENSASYIASWLSKLSDDPKLVIVAASQAQKASDFILSGSATEEEETEETE